MFLDRDGVLNEATVRGGRPLPPTSVEDVVIRAGVREACRGFRDAGLLLIVVTNQPDIARGTTTWESVHGINEYLMGELALDAVFVCAHDDADGCRCRKPEPGLLFSAADRFSLDLARSVMVGDRWRDIEAGARAGVSTVWVRSHYGEPPPSAPDHVVDGLLEVVPLVSSSLAVDEEAVR